MDAPQMDAHAWAPYWPAPGPTVPSLQTNISRPFVDAGKSRRSPQYKLRRQHGQFAPGDLASAARGNQTLDDHNLA